MNQTTKSPLLLRTRGMAAEIAARLRVMIDEGELPPGARIDEKDLSTAFDVSKTPLREALKVLVAEGRVTHRQYIGYRVAEIDLGDLASTFELLHGLEAMAGELVQQRITNTEIGAIAAKHRRMVECHDAGKRVEYFKLNQQIHQMIVDAADNPVLAGIYATLMAKVHRARGAANADTLRWAESASEHEAILAALEDPAHEGLPAVLREHSENTAREVLAVLMRATDDRPAARSGDFAREGA
ncbi:GntR family transcriptional regulator [Caballeronia arvi]|uniref:GntR family transcriptional regulator n=1 Tax=Caballeronia arvi TaxID=1777135 RepID=A0A158ISK6_9BURK|nr:GntR family transcriptional regulator [Caballeronia arvi]SAL59485.1 GntR family transcriptional regulator [Caballeronia arvi]